MSTLTEDEEKSEGRARLLARIAVALREILDKHQHCPICLSAWGGLIGAKEEYHSETCFVPEVTRLAIV